MQVQMQLLAKVLRRRAGELHEGLRWQARLMFGSLHTHEECVCISDCLSRECLITGGPKKKSSGTWDNRYIVVRSVGQGEHKKYFISWHKTEKSYTSRKDNSKDYPLERSTINMVRGEYTLCLPAHGTNAAYKLNFRPLDTVLSTLVTFIRVCLDCGSELGPMNCKTVHERVPKGWKEITAEDTFGAGAIGIKLEGNDRQVQILKVMPDSPIHGKKEYCKGLKLKLINHADIQVTLPIFRTQLVVEDVHMVFAVSYM